AESRVSPRSHIETIGPPTPMILPSCFCVLPSARRKYLRRFPTALSLSSGGGWSPLLLMRGMPRVLPDFIPQPYRTRLCSLENSTALKYCGTHAQTKDIHVRRYRRRIRWQQGCCEPARRWTTDVIVLATCR